MKFFKTMLCKLTLLTAISGYGAAVYATQPLPSLEIDPALGAPLLGGSVELINLALNAEFSSCIEQFQESGLSAVQVFFKELANGFQYTIYSASTLMAADGGPTYFKSGYLTLIADRKIGNRCSFETSPFVKVSGSSGSPLSW